MLTSKRLWLGVGAAALVAVVVGVAFSLWQAGNSLGPAGWQDACAQVKQPQSSGASPNWIVVSDSSTQTVAQQVSTLTVPYPDPTVALAPDTPLLVHPIRMHTGSDVNDCPHWIVAERDPSGHIVAIADYVYDYPHARVRLSMVGEIHSGDPQYSAPYPYLSEAGAVALVKSQRGVGAKAEPAPELVFLPLDMGLPEHPGKADGWRGGGSWPTDPIWLVAGADGNDYFVGTDMHVYTPRDIPMS